MSALSEGQAPEPVAQEPFTLEDRVLAPHAAKAISAEFRRMRATGCLEWEHKSGWTVIATSALKKLRAPAGMDAARAKAIEECARECEAGRDELYVQAGPYQAIGGPVYQEHMRRAFGFDAAAKRIRALATKGAGRVKCDGDHGGPRCADPECWQQ